MSRQLPPLARGSWGGSHSHLNCRITRNRKNQPRQPTNSPNPHRKNPFTCAAWQSLQSATGKAPLFDRTIDSLLFTLSNGDITAAVNPQNDCGKKTENLLKILREKPCLLVLDRADTLLKAREAKAGGYFADDCAEYAWLFKQLLETEHQSKIIFSSRESLAELPPTVSREIQLNGLHQDAAVALLQSFNLTAIQRN